MSVFFDNHGRNRGYESDAPSRETKISAFLERGGQSRWGRREREDPPLWGFSYDRAEGVIHLLLAFSIVGGLAALFSSGFFVPDAQKGPKLEARAVTPALPRPPTEAQSVAPPRALQTASPPQSEARSEAPPQADARPAATPALLLGSRTLAELGAMPAKALEPLAPPPAAAREKSGPADGPTQTDVVAAPEQLVAEAPPAPTDALAMSEEPAATGRARESEGSGRMAHCYLKLGRRVQTSGSCRVQRMENSVILQLPGKPLEIAHAYGRVWTATLGGRNLGKVYRSGACWGARGFYACESS